MTGVDNISGKKAGERSVSDTYMIRSRFPKNARNNTEDVKVVNEIA